MAEEHVDKDLDDPIHVLAVGTTTRIDDFVDAVEHIDGDWTVTQSPTAQGGIDQLVATEIDCVVSETDLRDGSGLDFLDAVRRSDSSVPFILIDTPTADPSLAHEAFASNVTEYFPCQPDGDIEILRKRVRTVVERHRTELRAIKLSRINSIMRDINGSLVQAASPTEIAETVCDRLYQADPYAYARLAVHDPESDGYPTQAVSGPPVNCIDDLFLREADRDEVRSPIDAAIDSHEIQIVQDLSDTTMYGDRAPDLMEQGFSASATVPLIYEEVVTGVLHLFTDRPDVFDDSERDFLADLGQDIAHGLDAVRTRHELRTTSQKYRTLIETAPDPIVLVDIDSGTIFDVNEAATELVGTSREELLGMDQTGLHPSGERTRYRTLFEHHLRQAPKTISEFPEDEQIFVATAEREHIPVEINASVLELDKSSLLVGIFRDISARRDRQQELRRYESIIENLPVGVYRCNPDPNDQFLETNPALASIFGTDSVDDLLDRSLADFSEDPDQLATLSNKIAKQGVVRNEVLALRTHGGQPIWVAVTAIRTEEDEEIYHDGIIQDITDEREREQQLGVIDRVLRHNLHNDMTVIRGFAEEIQRTCSGTIEEDAAQIVRRAEDLVELAEKEREIVKVLSEPSEPEPLNLVDTIEERLDSWAQSYPEAVIEFDRQPDLTVRATENLPDALDELLENALFHHDGEQPYVKIELDCRGDQGVVQVIDDGPGIPPEERPLLTDNTDVDPLYHGSGLGLWFVYWVVRRSNGSLSFEERDTGGNIVRIELSLSDDPSR